MEISIEKNYLLDGQVVLLLSDNVILSILFQ